MVNKAKKKRQFRKAMAQRSKDIARKQKELDDMKTDKALMNYFRKVGVIDGKGA